MGVWTVRGGRRLYGTVTVQGSRNSALALLAASLLHPGVTVLERVPPVTDVERFIGILRCLHCKVRQEGDRVTVDASGAVCGEIPRELTEGLRASVLFLGAMIGRFGRGSVPMPDSCSLGPRPLDLHLHALSCMGADLELDECAMTCKSCVLTGGRVRLSYPSVGATRQALLAACGCAGESVLRGCSKEPEVADLAWYLTKCGHVIEGIGTDVMTVRPGSAVGSVCHRLIPDRIAAGTLLCAGAACGGKLILQDISSSHLQPILDGLTEMGCNIKIQENTVTLLSDGRLWSPGGEFVTGPYPNFPTDCLPQMLAACLQADGVTVARERVMAGRSEAMRQLRRFGGDVTLTEDCGVAVGGVSALHGAHVELRDVQTGAAMLIAALQTPEESTLIDHGEIARGYAYWDAVLRLLGAEVSYSG